MFSKGLENTLKDRQLAKQKDIDPLDLVLLTIVLPNNVTLQQSFHKDASLDIIKQFLFKAPEFEKFALDVFGFEIGAKENPTFVTDDKFVLFTCAQAMPTVTVRILGIKVQKAPPSKSNKVEERSKFAFSAAFLKTYQLELVQQTQDLIFLKGQDCTVLIQFLDDVSYWVCVTDSRMQRPIFVNLHQTTKYRGLVGGNSMQFENPFDKSDTKNMEIMSISNNIAKAVNKKKVLQKQVKQYPTQNTTMGSASGGDVAGTVISTVGNGFGAMVGELAAGLFK